VIIDSHTHVDRFGWYDPPETIIRLMDEAGIDQSIIMTYVDAPDVDGSIEYIAESVRKYPGRLIGYARMNPRRGKGCPVAFQEGDGGVRLQRLEVASSR
jgi:predicted TIM-barrel fold metal-dependent hydrolase